MRDFHLQHVRSKNRKYDVLTSFRLDRRFDDEEISVLHDRKQTVYGRKKEGQIASLVFVRSWHGHNKNVRLHRFRLSFEVSSLQDRRQQFRNTFFLKRAVAAFDLIYFLLAEIKASDFDPCI